VVKEEWAECTSVMLDDIGTGMSQLFLKEEPVDVAPSATDDNVNVLKEVLIGVCGNFSDKLRSSKELHQMPKLECCLNQNGGFQSTYTSEVRGTCYRAPSWLIKLFKYPVPHTMKRYPNDDNLLSYEDPLMKQAFGFITLEHNMPSRQGKSSKTGNKDQRWTIHGSPSQEDI
jgi:hypothetical protein